tara:strand:+ start:104 stop:682 length:579 start_codon:yes stop_codon:yes gene_type:complete
MLEFIQDIRVKFNKLIFILFYSWSFKKFGRRSTLSFPFRVNGPKYITIGHKVHISEGSWILAKRIDKDPQIKIHDGTYIGRSTHIVSISGINIQQNVLISDKVYLSDNLHEYKNIELPIKSQKILDKGPISIGENTWIGENVCVIGSSIGKHCVIGSNSVVLSNIPDYSVAVGSPAKVIKRYNQITKDWERV